MDCKCKAGVRSRCYVWFLSASLHPVCLLLGSQGWGRTGVLMTSSSSGTERGSFSPSPCTATGHSCPARPLCGCGASGAGQWRGEGEQSAARFFCSSSSFLLLGVLIQRWEQWPVAGKQGCGQPTNLLLKASASSTLFGEVG